MAPLQLLQYRLHARQGFTVPKHIDLQLGLALVELFVRDGQFGPVMEDLARGGAGPALQLGFDRPGEVGPIVLAQDGVGDGGVGVLAVDEEAVHVEDAGPDGREATDKARD